VDKEEIIRVETPKENQLLGVVLMLLGHGKFEVYATDGKTRICRIPGRVRRKLRIKEGDVVLIEPWEVSKDKKADILRVYTSTEVEWLKKEGFLKDLEDYV